MQTIKLLKVANIALQICFAKKIAIEAKERDEAHRIDLDNLKMELSEVQAALEVARSNELAAKEAQAHLDSVDTDLRATNERMQVQIEELKRSNKDWPQCASLEKGFKQNCLPM